MEIPKIKTQERIDRRDPAVFLYEGMGLYRGRIAVQLPRDHAGCFVAAFEAAEIRPYKKKRLSILYEYTNDDAGLLLDHLIEVKELLHIEQIYGRLTSREAYFISWRNDESRAERKKELLIGLPPMSRQDGIISYHLDVLKDLGRTGRERVFFRDGSKLPQEISQLPSNTHKITDTERPLLAVTAYVIAALSIYQTVEPDMQHDKRPEYDPLDMDRKDPPGVRLSYDIFANV